jgi:Chemoreceptor zinc-binding domain
MQLISEDNGAGIGKSANRFERMRDAVSIGIDFVEVAEAHVLLFGRVKQFVHGEIPEARNLVELEQGCELGRWLKGIGAARFGHLRSFSRLFEAHADFHQQATGVLDKIHTGSWVAAEQMRKSELARALRWVLISLTELNDSINKQAQRIN